MTWHWKQTKGPKIVSADEAMSIVKPGDHVVCTMASPIMTPISLILALAKRAPELENVTIDTTFSAAGGLGLLEDAANGAFELTSAFVYSQAETVELNRHGPRANYIPMHPHLMGTIADHSGREDFTRRFTGGDVFVTKVTPPSANGFVSFGTNVWNSRAQMANAQIRIGEVDPSLPSIPGGDNWAHVSDFEYLVETMPFEMPSFFEEPPAWEVEPTQVCGYLTAELINNGDTVMFGGGAMPSRMGEFLTQKEDLGCHSEVVIPLGLVQAGVINGKKRNLVPGKISLTGLIPRSEDEHAYVDGNPLFELRDMSTNNNPKYIAQNDNLVAINAPLEITLWGEIGCERVGDRYFRGVGGQVEFVVGALLSTGGRSIHSVLSRKQLASGEWASTIVPEFTPPGTASISRQFADIVVTEFGVARLLGKTERERAQELISVAHPDFRPGLREAMKRAFGLGSVTSVPAR